MAEENKKHAAEFAASIRGRYVISQALHYAIKTLEQVDEARQEVSNIDDMKYIHRNVYPLFKDLSDSLGADNGN